MRTIHREIVSALIFSKDGKLLMGMKDPESGGVYADCWHIPGGGVGENETQLEALRREVLEEVGIDVSPYKIVLADNKGTGETEKTLKDAGETVLCKMQFNVYRVNIDKDPAEIETRPSDDLVKLEWAAPTKLSGYMLTPPSIALFERLGLIELTTCGAGDHVRKVTPRENVSIYTEDMTNKTPLTADDALEPDDIGIATGRDLQLPEDHQPPAAPAPDLDKHIPLDHPLTDSGIDAQELYDEGLKSATDIDAQDETEADKNDAIYGN